MNDKHEYNSENGSRFKVIFSNKVVNREVLLEVTNTNILERYYSNPKKKFNNQKDIVHYLKEHVETDGLIIRVIGV
jgi:hypothetical protein